MNKHIVTLIIALIVGAGSFYAGTRYSSGSGGGNRGNFANLSPQERQARFGGLGGGGLRPEALPGGQIRGAARENAQFVGGEIIKKDDTSVTIKLMDGGSKIIFFSASTTVGKMSEGTLADLIAGKFVTVSGPQNTDGTVTADSIQLRPTPLPGAIRSTSTTR